MTARRQSRPVVPAWEQPAVTKPVAIAVRALAAGTATEDQQRRALWWIVTIAAAADDLSYRPGLDGDRETCFAEGRRFVGAQVRRLVNMSGERLEKLDG